MKIIMKTIGQNIRTLRQQKGWSQSEVAQRLHISIPAVSKIENGNTDVNFSRLQQIAEIFGIRTHEIISKSDEAAKKQVGLEAMELREKISARDSEIIALQVKLIQLYEELRM